MTQESISKLPYAALSAKIGDGSETMLVLGRMDGTDHHYFAQDKAFIIVRHGRVVRSHGLPHNLWYTGFSTEDLFAQGLHTLKAPMTEKRIIDLNREGLQQIQVHATFKPEGTEKLDIYGREYPLIRIRECVSVPQLKWHYENIHWVFAHNGMVMRSMQHLHPSLGPIELIMLRPAATR